MRRKGKRIALSHDSRLNRDNHISLKFKFEAGKSLNNQDLIFPVSNVEASKSSSNWLSLFEHIHDEQRRDGRRRQDTRDARIA